MAVAWGALLLAAAVGLTAGAARRLASRVLPADSSSEGLLRAILAAVVIAVSSVAVLGLAGVLVPAAILAAAALWYLAARALPAAPPSAGTEGVPWPRAIRWPAVLTGLLVALDVAAFLPASPVDWDAATYHLHLPGRWLQEGRLFHVPTPFSDNAAAFAPHNGAVFFTWQMALSGRDAVVNVSQLLCLAFLGLALYRIGQLLGAARGPAAMAALTLPWLAPIRRWTYSANVDVFMVAFAFGALYWALCYRRDAERPAIVAGGLAAGLTAGAKTLGLPLAALATLPAVWAAARRRRFADLGIFGACALFSGGWWYLMNLWRYGNPLFPVKLSLGLLELPGAYGPAAIRAGEFHLGSALEVAAGVLDRYGAATCLLMVLGLLALAWRSAGDLRQGGGEQGHAPLHLLLQALAWAAFFVFVVPHNDQARFLLPALAAGLAGWALALDRAGRVSPAAAHLLWLAGAAAAASASKPWLDWGSSVATLGVAGVAAGRWLATAALCGAVAAGCLVLRRRLGWLSTAAVWVTAWGLVALATLHADAARPACFAGADYRGWAEGYLPFNHPSRPPARIAYTGANVPYALAGVGWRHRVIYADTQGEQGDGFYQHWDRDRGGSPGGASATYAYHKPGLYRGRDDVELWLRHLEQLEIDTLVIFRLHRAEQRYIRSTPDGFPIEQAWARRRPERFEPIFTGRAAEVYRLLER